MAETQEKQGLDFTLRVTTRPKFPTRQMGVGAKTKERETDSRENKREK